MLRIIKLGGSLFDLPDLPARLNAWLSRQEPATNVIVAGGGPLADAIRTWDQRFQLGDEASHWFCIDLLDVTAKLVAMLLPGSILCDRLEDFAHMSATAGLSSSECGVDHQAIRNQRGTVSFEPSPRLRFGLVYVFAPARFLRKDEPGLPGERLPQSWDVTSDSIAARLAEVTQAGELVLLKSSLPDDANSYNLFAPPHVDEHFRQAARHLKRVRLVNLRDSSE